MWYKITTWIDHEILSTVILYLCFVVYRSYQVQLILVNYSMHRNDSVAELCSVKFNVAHCHYPEWKLPTLSIVTDIYFQVIKILSFVLNRFSSPIFQIIIILSFVLSSFFLPFFIMTLYLLDDSLFGINDIKWSRDFEDARRRICKLLELCSLYGFLPPLFTLQQQLIKIFITMIQVKPNRYKFLFSFVVFICFIIYFGCCCFLFSFIKYPGRLVWRDVIYVIKLSVKFTLIVIWLQ
jgi:hypothetical protein